MTGKHVPHRFSTIGAELKRCRTCHNWKPIEQFATDRSRWDELWVDCRCCCSTRMRQARIKKLGYVTRTSNAIPHRFGVDNAELKRCGKCKQWLSLQSFNKKSTTRDGYNCYCKSCHREYQIQWRHGPGKESNDGSQDRYREIHREECRETNRRWAKANPEKAVARAERRRARVLGASGEMTSEEWQELRELAEFRCLRCGEQKPLTQDHVIPLTAGGTNDIDNIQPLCQSCNSRKGIKLGWDFRPILIPYEELGDGYA